MKIPSFKSETLAKGSSQLLNNFCRQNFLSFFYKRIEMTKSVRLMSSLWPIHCSSPNHLHRYQRACEMRTLVSHQHLYWPSFKISQINFITSHKFQVIVTNNTMMPCPKYRWLIQSHKTIWSLREMIKKGEDGIWVSWCWLKIKLFLVLHFIFCEYAVKRKLLFSFKI